MRIRVFDVEHGACALVEAPNGGTALIDCGTNNSTGWTPADYLISSLNRRWIDYLIITNADQDHYTNLTDLATRVGIGTLITNPSLGAGAFEAIKLQSGPLTKDAITYRSLKQTFSAPTDSWFDDKMGGVQLDLFWNNFPDFVDTNNLSLAAAISYNGFRILFPGDLEDEGWLALLGDAGFRATLRETTILVASHHGRQNGYCAEVFDYCRPSAVVVSDKPIAHATQLTVPQYQNCLAGNGVRVVGVERNRHVLTTRRDGCIRFDVDASGGFWIHTRDSWQR